MSPTSALHNPIFLHYIAIVATLLLIAGTVLALLQCLFRVELGSVWKTWQSWLWMAPLAALAISAGRAVFICSVAALALLGFREFARASALKNKPALKLAVSAGIIGIGIAAIVNAGFAGASLGAIVLISLVATVAGGVDPGSKQRAGSAGVSAPGYNTDAFASAMVAFVFFGTMFGQLAFLANSRNAYGYLCFLLFATETSDVAAFVFGRTLGRHPLQPAISPRKTVEGSLGALFVALALPWLLRFSFPNFSALQLVLTGLVVGLGGQLGDLTFSLLKRGRGLKDWGDAIPGHGGVLDRIDSLIFVAPLFTLLTAYYDQGR